MSALHFTGEGNRLTLLNEGRGSSTLPALIAGATTSLAPRGRARAELTRL